MLNKKLEQLMTMFNFGAHFLKDLELPSFLSSDNTTKSGDEKLKAHRSGKGQIDERLFASACARATTRLVNDHGLTAEEARIRIAKIVKIINSHDPLRRRNIILTIGLEQTAVPKTENATGGKEKKGKKKKAKEKEENKPEIILQNVDGQDIIIMMALANKPNFTKAMCKSMSTQNDVMDHYLSMFAKLGDRLDNICLSMAKSNGFDTVEQYEAYIDLGIQRDRATASRNPWQAMFGKKY